MNKVEFLKRQKRINLIGMILSVIFAIIGFYIGMFGFNSGSTLILLFGFFLLAVSVIVFLLCDSGNKAIDDQIYS